MTYQEKEYVIGTGTDELNRLAIQHRVWSDTTTAAWTRAGIGMGAKVLDVGCGPGYATADLAQLVTTKGLALGLDESSGFVDYVKTQARLLQIPQLDARVGDAQNITAAFSSGEKFDAIYCRWVLCWLKEPKKAIEGMRQVLKPGGRVVIHDYFNWRAMCAAPRSKAIEKMVQAAVASFEAHNANVDIAAHLPAMLRAAGFEMQYFTVHQRLAIGGGTDSGLSWVLTWWRTYGPKLVETGYLSAAECTEALDDLALLERSPDRFFMGPPLFEFIAKI